MEISPKLFDECTNKYKQSRQMERKKQKDRDDAWAKVEAAAAVNATKLPIQSVPVLPMRTSEMARGTILNTDWIYE